MQAVQKAILDPTRKIPTSAQFDDVYFSDTNAIGESRYYFINGNNLPNRFTEYLNNQKDFVIAETGFGTGLNFLLAAELWQQTIESTLANVTEKKPTNLHFISAEKYPIQQHQLVEIYQRLGWKSHIAQSLLKHYPQQLDTGAYTIDLNSEGIPVKLTLLLGDASEQFQSYEFHTNAWFLDGFNPAKNPDMWTQTLFDTMAKRSADNATFATFTAASSVRKGLKNADFTVKKGSGFELKREFLFGHYTSS